PWTREVLAFLKHVAWEGLRDVEGAHGVEVLDLALLSPEPPVILLDLVMPTLTGFEVLARVATHAALAARHRWIVPSARPHNRVLEIGTHLADLLQRLGLPFVGKPFDSEDLLRVVWASYVRLLPPEHLLGNRAHGVGHCAAPGRSGV